MHTISLTDFSGNASAPSAGTFSLLRYLAMIPASLRRLGAVLIAMAIFYVDTVSSLDIAVAVLYAIVILLSIDMFSRTGILAVSLGCLLLISVAYCVTHGLGYRDEAFGRFLISLVAIIISALLALKTKLSKEQLQQQIRLLHRSEAFLAGAQSLSLTGTIGFDMSVAGVYWSDEARRIFEFDASSSPSLEQMILQAHPEDQAGLRKTIYSTCTERVHFETEFRILPRGGRCKYLRMLARQIPHMGDHCEFVGALMDITAARQADEALHRTQSELAHVTRATTLGELAASIAHEVNQPLSAVITDAEAGLRWLGRAEPDTQEVKSAIERIVVQANRASEVVRRVRALSRKNDRQTETLDLAVIVEEAVGLVNREVSRQGIALQMSFAPSLREICADRVQLQQVIINLIMNAVQSISGHTGITRTLAIRLYQPDQQRLILQVIDSGSGISEQHLPDLFHPFFTTKPKGMGMGLSICRSIIEAHGGRIWAGNNPQGGAQFSFSLPFAEQPLQ